MTQDNKEYQVPQNRNGQGAAVFTGLLLGGVTGAIAGLLLAPQSGKDTRGQIRNKATEVRDRAGQKVDDTVAQVRSRAEEVKAGVGSKAKELRQRGEDVLVEQLDRVSAAAEAGKKNIQGART